MDDKPKRKRGSPSLWSFPRAFRYEVKGDLPHIIQAIESLEDRFYKHEVQISSDALDDEVAFSIYRYSHLIETNTFGLDKERPIALEAHGYIRLIQPGTLVVEGYAWRGLGERGCGCALFVISLFIGGLILFTIQQTQQAEVALCGIPLLLILVTSIVGLYDRQASFENFFRVLQETLQAYSTPLNDNSTAGTDQALQTALHSRKIMADKFKRKHREPAWWQFPYRFSYRIESSYEDVIRILESLEHKTPGSWMNVTLYSDGKGQETEFDLDLRVHGKEGKWNVETHITGHMYEQESYVILEGILMEPFEHRNVMIGFLSIIGFFILGSWAVGMPLIGLFGVTVLCGMATMGSKSNRAALFYHLLEGLQKAKTPIFALTEDEQRELQNSTPLV